MNIEYMYITGVPSTVPEWHCEGKWRVAAHRGKRFGRRVGEARAAAPRPASVA